MANHLYYGDNLAVLRDSIGDGSVDLIYLDPPVNSTRAGTCGWLTAGRRHGKGTWDIGLRMIRVGVPCRAIIFGLIAPYGPAKAGATREKFEPRAVAAAFDQRKLFVRFAAVFAFPG